MDLLAAVALGEVRPEDFSVPQAGPVVLGEARPPLDFKPSGATVASPDGAPGAEGLIQLLYQRTPPPPDYTQPAQRHVLTPRNDNQAWNYQAEEAWHFPALQQDNYEWNTSMQHHGSYSPNAVYNNSPMDWMGDENYGDMLSTHHTQHIPVRSTHDDDHYAFPDLKRARSPTLASDTPMKRAQVDLSSSVTPSAAPKPRRGRPPGSKSKTTTAKGKATVMVTPVPVPEKKPGKKGSKKVAKKLEGEERVVTEKKQFSHEEATNLFVFLLDADADTVFDKLTMSSNKCWSEFDPKEIGINATADQMKSFFDRHMADFKKMDELENFTGNGADPDEVDWDSEESISAFIASRQNAGKDTDGINAAKYKLWKKLGWYKLFYDRFHTNPKVHRPVPRSSIYLSDTENTLEVIDDDDENDDNSDADVQIINKSTKLSVHAPLSNTPVKRELAKDPRPTKANDSQTSSRPVGKGQKSTAFTQMSTLLQGQLEVQQEGLKLQREARAARVQAEKEAKEAKEATDALECGTTLQRWSRHT
ncbi:hypothetical protein GGX14DRAFT_402038 [Mycena pura]|uniref:No apical meristem-associated C-terminal domain-containing protein n=1 Tax=Mycena pura TaxID=153505 RepID=A0AAD6UYZ0_9AGAR|nr:hypothetical protein GGX14DRAFT_402038 [Mycena pura]